MSRFWTDLVAGPIDALGTGAVALVVIGAALLIGAAWQWFPAWIPRRRPRKSWQRPRLRWRRPQRAPREQTSPTPITTAVDTLPDEPAATFVDRADSFAQQGRYAEAIRERLRAIVRELVDTGVIPPHPEWTVTELARAAAHAQPALRPPLDGASRTFSDIWYGQRPPSAAHDAAMRAHADDVHTVLRAEASR